MLLPLLLAMQAQVVSAAEQVPPIPPPSAPTAAVSSTSVQATFATMAPTIDARGDDPIWRSAPIITDFLVVKPREGAAPQLRTQAQIAYDSQHLYVLVRAFDPHPDSIVALLARRDDQTPSDQIDVMIDSYHDRRTGFEFFVNPAGVKVDYAIYNDGDEDPSWNGVWDVATRVDSLGWIAEYRIPLSQLRYRAVADGTFGIAIVRVVERYPETVSWPLLRQSRPGLPSQFGELAGLRGLTSPGGIEVVPYLVAKSSPGNPVNRFDQSQQITAGGDLRYHAGSGFVLNATVNPDFGQVEADPSVLNLGAFETFFDEQRPFFVDGKGLFTFNVNCVVVVDCRTGEGLFYSRRIGRSPQLGSVYGNASSPDATRILGAAKLSGKLGTGLSIGALDAVTQHVRGPGATTLEPTTNYGVVRINQDIARGNGNIGFMMTSVNRSLDASSEPYLHRSAYSGGIDARRRVGRFEASASFDLSRVEGSPAAIARTQQNPVHLYQRPDGGLVFDPTRTSLSGSNVELRFAKVGGTHLQFETAYQRRTPGFEINDAGFLLQADQQIWSTWAALAFRTPNKVFQSLRWNINNWEHWSIAGLPTDRAINTNVHIQFVNNWAVHVGGTLGQLGATYCDRCARGGPAVRQDPYFNPWFMIQGDDRHRVVPGISVHTLRTDRGRTADLSIEPSVTLNVASRLTSSASISWDGNHNDTQYFGTFLDGGGAPHYTFAHLDQKTVALTFRLGYTFSPTTTLQVYASPFISKGTFSDVRELDQPRAAAYDARYRPYHGNAAATPGGFDVQQFRSNVVFRWEFHPGSALFLVWSQGRDAGADLVHSSSIGREFGELFDRRAHDTFLVKVSYWFAR